jgi:hypothetical protein
MESSILNFTGKRFAAEDELTENAESMNVEKLPAAVEVPQGAEHPIADLGTIPIGVGSEDFDEATTENVFAEGKV